MTAHRRKPWVEGADIKKAVMLAVAAPVAWAVPARHWPRLTAIVAARAALFDAPSHPLPPGLVSLLGGDENAALARLRRAYFEDCMLTLRAWAPWATRIEVGIHGAEHLEAALAGGRGAVVWVAPTAASSLVSKIALAEFGHPAVHLSRASHRFARSRAGIATLNRLTRVEDRYLRERVVMNDEAPAGALLRLRRRLEEGRVVSIFARGPASQTVSVPFMGGEWALPAGALQLGLGAGVGVLPLVVLQEEPSRFQAVIAAPLAMEAEGGRGAAVAGAAREFAAVVDAHLRDHPWAWQGWMTW